MNLGRDEINVLSQKSPLIQSEKRVQSFDYLPTLMIEKDPGTSGPRRDPAGAGPYSAAIKST